MTNPRLVGPVGVAILGSTLLLGACSKSAMQIDSPDEIYGESVLHHANERHEAAISGYREMLDHYPLDSRAEEVELRIAHAHLANNDYPEAIAAFSDFQRMHPTSTHLPEVEYRLGQAYAEQIDTIDRDQGAAMNAHYRLQSLLARHPDSEFATQARSMLLDVRENLAGREFYIAEFYFERGHYRAGWMRTAKILSQYPETSAAAGAAKRLAEAALENEDQRTAVLADAAALELMPRTGEEEIDPTSRRRLASGPAVTDLRIHLRTPPPIIDRNPLLDAAG